MKSTAFALALVVAASACSRPKPVKVTPRSVQVAALEPQGVQLALLLDVQNPNGFAITASDVKGTFEVVGGGELGRGTATEAFTVPAERTAEVPTTLRVKWMSVSVLAPYALSGQPLPYRIHGSARIGSQSLNIEVPFDISGELTREQVIQAGLRGAAGLIPALPP